MTAVGSTPALRAESQGKFSDSFIPSTGTNQLRPAHSLQIPYACLDAPLLQTPPF